MDPSKVPPFYATQSDSAIPRTAECVSKIHQTQSYMPPKCKHDCVPPGTKSACPHTTSECICSCLTPLASVASRLVRQTAFCLHADAFVNLACSQS
ncbi:hypothetical protein VFPFJ_07332 [Purpureocillium lilacinum]|uniref:Uncharacterized protein n=1 Tax=Purpureocillium lilacinum TaxID=33203 RepID=A0A179HF71_PURLI|nr:hypothetical protein VFPFJ_07332 [Purpureocillium lilacinum]OAQ88867.1 hypothetical protein VFPFJ_07332 [Purpureocillium lilacinum]